MCRASSTCSRRTGYRSRKAGAQASTSRSCTATTRSRPAAYPISRSRMAKRREAASTGRGMKSVLRCLALAAALVPLAAAAQTYPTRAVRLMVPFPPGGATDIVGRLVSAKMQDVWGQPVVVENRPGAGTVVGTDYVAKSAPDGYTLGMVVTAYVINPSLRSNLPYDTRKDLVAVTQVSSQQLVIAANPSLPANNMAELIQ